MRACPQCGAEGDFGLAKFCHNCGNRLDQDYQSQKRSADKATSSSLTSSNAIFEEITDYETNDNNIPLIKESN
jgi:hypothetical protein